MLYWNPWRNGLIAGDMDVYLMGRSYLAHSSRTQSYGKPETTLTLLAQLPRKAEIRTRRQNGIRRHASRKTILLLFYLLFVICSFAYAARWNQANTATAKVEGTVFVRDSAGNQSSVAGAKVKLNGPATLETETDGNGTFVVAAVPAVPYTVEAVFPGFESQQTVRVEARDVSVPLELKPIEVSTSVVVAAEPLETKEKPAPSTTISEKTLRDPPNVNERFENSLPLIPGIVRGSDGRVNLKGTRNTQSGELVNSANVTDPVTGSPAINLPIDVL